LTPGGSSTVHIETQTVHTIQRTEQYKEKIGKCGPCPVFAIHNLEFSLQLRKSTEEPQLGFKKTSVRLNKKTQVRKKSGDVGENLRLEKNLC
jgi:hypothetical protein